MKGLLLDTSSKNALIAITQNGKVVLSSIIEGAKTLSSTLFPTLESLLKQGEMKIQDFHYIGVGVGPGSYMGIRTAASIANTLSFGANLPLVEFFSPFAFLPEKEGHFTFIGDGKMGKLFVLKGTKNGSFIEDIEGPSLVNEEDLGSHVENKDFLVQEPYIINLNWLSAYVHQLYLDGKISSSPSAQLAYLHE